MKVVSNHCLPFWFTLYSEGASLGLDMLATMVWVRQVALAKVELTQFEDGIAPQ